MICFGHENLRVADLNRSIKFYEDAIGLSEIHRIEDVDYIIVWMHFNRAADNAPNCGAGGEDTKPLPFFLELRWDKNHCGAYNLGDNSTHIAFTCTSRDELYLRHKNMGIIDMEIAGSGIYFIHDPDGYSIEIMPESFVRRALD